MVKSVSHVTVPDARTADLYSFCLRNHPELFEKEGSSIRPIFNHSISIKKGYSGYRDFATGQNGNAIDFLMHYLDYTFVGAVSALADMPQKEQEADCLPPVNTPAKAPFSLPPAASAPYTQLISYLHKTRRIPLPVIQKMIDHRILYQDAGHNNLVFVNAERTMVEIHGTSGAPFKQTQYHSDTSAFWWFKAKGMTGPPSSIYVCESAIDAMSLFSIHAYEHAMKPISSTFTDIQTLYVSLSGVSNTQKVDCLIQHRHDPVFLYFAMDNDTAGHALWEKYKGQNIYITSRFPPNPYKDWNEMLQAEIDSYEKQRSITFTLPDYT